MRFRKSSRVALRSVFFIVFLLSSSYFVVQVRASEPSLIDIFNYFGFTNVAETTVETFTSGTYNITLYAEFAGYCDENELSYYEVDTSIFNVIFTGPEGGSGYLSPPITKTFTADYEFGLSMLSPGPHRYFTETSKNPDGEHHAKVYKNQDDPNMFLIGFENFYGGGDRDYNDMVFSLECAHDLTVSAGVGGVTDPVPGVYSHPCGSSVPVEAIPDSCYVFDHWELDSVDVGSANPYSVLMDDDHALHAVFTQISYDLTISAGVGGTTDPVPEVYSHPCGSSVDITAIPDEGYRFDHWVLDCSPAGSANPISVPIDDNHDLEAVFAEIHTLTIIVSEGGTTDPSPGTHTYETPTDVVVEAIPSAYYLFDYWEFDGEDIGSENPVTVYVGSSHTLKAFFTPMTYQLTITTTSGGTTNPAPGTYPHGYSSYVSVEAFPDSCYVFDHWELDGDDVGSANPYSVLMDDDHTLHAVFSQISYDLTISAGVGGTTDPVPEVYPHPCGSYVSVEAFPDSCYVFDHWELDGDDVGSANPYSVLMDDDHTLHAVFTYSPPPLSVSISPPSASIFIGDSVSFTSARSGGSPPYTYQWYLDDAPVSGATSSSWTFTPPSTGTYDVHLKVTDACDSTAQSGIAKVTVTPPIGGYSVSLTKPVAKTPLICYTMLLAIFALATGLIRRKRK